VLKKEKKGSTDSNSGYNKARLINSTPAPEL
jgi:hypothetical protein